MPTIGPSLIDILCVALLGLATTSSVMLGAVIGLYVPFPKKVLAGVLAFASGSLIAALAIDLGFEGARDLVSHGFSVHGAWLLIDRTIFFLWSTVLAAGVVAAVAGKFFISGSESTAAVLAKRWQAARSWRWSPML